MNSSPVNLPPLPRIRSKKYMAALQLRNSNSFLLKPLSSSLNYGPTSPEVVPPLWPPSLQLQHWWNILPRVALKVDPRKVDLPPLETLVLNNTMWLRQTARETIQLSSYQKAPNDVASLWFIIDAPWPYEFASNKKCVLLGEVAPTFH